MPDYYKKVKGHLVNGEIAYAEDINLIQVNVADAFKAAISDHHEHTSYILGQQEDAFKLLPAPKRLGRYIDTMNLVESGNEKWLSLRKWGYRQRIKKSKTSLYSVICKFRNLSKDPITLWCKLEGRDGRKMTSTRTSVTIPANTESAEFEIIFDLKHLPTAPGLSHQDVEAFDSKYIAPPPKEECIESGIDHKKEQDIKNFTVGASEIYFIIEPLNINETDIAINGDEDNIITDDTFAVLADKSGSYGKLLEQSNGIDYNQTAYDLYFKDIYATTSTYLCEWGEAIIDGEKVKCIDTHVSIAGANEFGNVDTYVYMNTKGHLCAVNSPAYFNKNTTNINLPGAILPIAIITTYMNDVKQPVVYQDDTSMVVRPRSHHERLRRLEKKTRYLEDIAIPPRLKYTLAGGDLVNNNPDAEVGVIDNGNYYLTTDQRGNVVIRSTQAEVINIPITLKETEEELKKTGITTITEDDKQIRINNDLNPAKQLAEITDMEHNQEEGTLKLKPLQEKTSGVIGMTDEEAQATEFNPWDDDAANRPSDGFEPIEREYAVVRGRDSDDDWDSEFPAMTFYTEKGYNLKSINIPITKFKNCEGIKFIIWRRQGPNDKTNEVWFEKRIYDSPTFSLDNAKEQDGFQIVEDGFTIEVSSSGLNLPAGQYVLVCFPIPKSGTGSCFVSTYKPENSKDFCIRYYGAGNGSHFLLKERYQEVWYNAAKFTGTETQLAKEGSVTSGTITWENQEPIASVTAFANITTPENCSYELYADTGGGFQQLELDKPVAMTGGGMSFKWKLVFKGDGDTPVLAYDDDKKYAISFELTRKQPDAGVYSDSNDCITTKTFKAEDILKEYIGDDNFNSTGKFSNYEFVRFWGDDLIMDDFTSAIVIDVAGSDHEDIITYPVTVDGETHDESIKTDIFSFYYADLTLEDFNTTSVDYNNYDSAVEYDEHNLRLKLDTDHSYNDNNISLYTKSDGYKGTVSDDYFEAEGITFAYLDKGHTAIEGLNFAATTSPSVNKTIFKRVSKTYMDLSQYTSIQLRLGIYGVPKNDFYTAVMGLGLYISSAEEEETPSFIEDDDNDEIIMGGSDVLPDDLSMDSEDLIKKYYGKIIRIEQTQNDVTQICYFKYVKSSEGKYVKQQIHNLKSYELYALPDLNFLNKREKGDWDGDEDVDKSVLYVTINIDTNNINLSRAKEIGIFTSVDNNMYQVDNDFGFQVEEIKGIRDDYVPIYNPAENKAFKPFRDDLAGSDNHYTSILQTQKINYDVTKDIDPQKRCRIDMYYNRIAGDGEIIAYHPVDKSFVNYKHMSAQLAANCWLPKNALELHLCSDTKGRESVFSLKIPTLNLIHNPVASEVTPGQDDGFVNFAQIFKKINKDMTIRSISIRATSRFKEYMKEIRATDQTGYVSLYIGKIVVYKAETIPLFYKNMRMKIYDNNQLQYGLHMASVRKVGCVIEYK